MNTITPLNNIMGQSVDWWFAYKLPTAIGPESNTTGFEFLYCDSNNDKELGLSEIKLDDEKSAIALTLKQVFDKNPDSGYILWNDEIPPIPGNPVHADNKGKGHSKGILAFSKKSNSGFYLLHSTPRFPLEAELTLPEDEKIYGQAYLCVGLKDYQTANDIADILLHQNDVQVYASHIPEVANTESLYQLAFNQRSGIPAEPATYSFETQNGIPFQLLAKNKHWSMAKTGDESGKDFWEDLVCPVLKTDFSVETWRRGLVFRDQEAGITEITTDIVDIDLSGNGLAGYKWAFTQDHSKWGVSKDEKDAYVVIADINRQISQSKRGGGGLAFKNKAPLAINPLNGPVADQAGSVWIDCGS